MADQGYGQQDPSDIASPTNANLFTIEQMLSLINTAKIVVVKAVDTGAKMVDVQPMVKQIDGQGNVSSHGTINAIPYFGGMQAGLNEVIMDPVVGDKGLMICCDRDISSVLNSKSEAPPGSYRKYDPADGIYIGGLPGLNGAATQWVKFSDTGLELADKNSNKLVSSSTGWAFTGPVTFNSTIDVKGAATFDSTIDVKGAATFDSTIDVKGAATFDSTIDVKGVSSLENNLQLGGSLLGISGGVYSLPIHISGNFNSDGTVTGNINVVGGGLSLNSHVHAYVAPGVGYTGAITPTNGPNNP